MNQEQYMQAVMAGPGLAQAARIWVEPFSGNALYYSRRTGTMEQYKTVKEVCALTGLTGKHLYYFHHESVVRAAAYANYSVEGNDGYKLYDEKGVEKLQQIALLYELGLKRNEIRDLMLAPGYDFQLTLTELHDRKEMEIEKIGLQLAAMDYLRMTGIHNGLAGILRRCSLETLGRCLVEQRENTGFDLPDSSKIHQFETGFSKLLLKIQELPERKRDSEQKMKYIRELLELSRECFGESGKPFLIGLLLGAAGEGDLGKNMKDILSPELADEILGGIEGLLRVQKAEISPKVGV